MIIIGERVNSSRKRIAEAIETGKVSFIQKEAMMQVQAGADYLDLNGVNWIRLKSACNDCASAFASNVLPAP